MTSDVTWQPLSVDAPGSAAADLDRTGAVALVPVGDRDWSAGAAVSLARSLARGGRRVFLCDLDLASPRLHTLLGVPAGEGVTDFVHWGASPGRVATEVEDRLHLVPAGTPVADHAATLKSERWAAFVEAAIHARACVLFFVPADVGGFEALLGRAETLVALGPRLEVPDLGSAAPRLKVGFEPVPAQPDVAAGPGAGGRGPQEVPLVPEVVASIPEPEPPGEVPDEAEAGDEAPGGPDTAPSRESVPTRAGVQSDGGRPASGATPRTPPPHPHRLPPRSEPPPRRRTGVWWTVLLFLVVVVALLWWLGVVEIPGTASRRSEAADPPRPDPAGEMASPPAATAGDDAAPAGLGAGGLPPDEPTSAPTTVTAGSGPAPTAAVSAPVQRWAVRIAAYRSREAALEDAALLAIRAPEAFFVVVPVDVQGARWYRLLTAVGPERDDAEALRGELARTLGVDPDQWLVRTAPLAFLLLETADRGEASARVEELLAQRIDAYVLEAPRVDGTTAFRVYAGAFADAAEAGALRGLLAERSLSAVLVERRGVRPR